MKTAATVTGGQEELSLPEREAVIDKESCKQSREKAEILWVREEGRNLFRKRGKKENPTSHVKSQGNTLNDQ